MPFYIYKCPVCGHEEEHLHSMTECNDEPKNPWNKIKCPKCGKKKKSKSQKGENSNKKVVQKIKNISENIILKRLIGGGLVNFMGTGQKEYFKNDSNHPDGADY